VTSLYPDRDASGFCERAARRDERVMRDASRMLRGEGPVNTTLTDDLDWRADSLETWLRAETGDDRVTVRLTCRIDGVDFTVHAYTAPDIDECGVHTRGRDVTRSGHVERLGQLRGSMLDALDERDDDEPWRNGVTGGR